MTTSQTQLAALKMFAARRRITFVATALELVPTQVKAIAHEHGCLRGDGEIDFVTAAHAATELERRLNVTAGAIPTRDPEPAKPRPAPPVRVTAPPAARAPAPMSRPVEVVDLAAYDSAQVLMEARLDELHADPGNPREDVGDVADLAASMQAVSLLQPVVARRAPDGRLVLVAGHRRLAAARLLGWERIPTVVRRAMRPDDVLAAMLVENGHRKDLDPIEEARALRRLQVMHGDCPHSVLAGKVGRHQAHVSGRLALLALSAEDQDAVRAGDMKLVEATEKARLNSGRVRPARPNSAYFSAAHELAPLAKARCRRLHARVVTMPGGIACGDCWSSVIRADERQHLHGHSARTGTCAICAAPIDTTIREANTA